MADDAEQWRSGLSDGYRGDGVSLSLDGESGFARARAQGEAPRQAHEREVAIALQPREAAGRYGFLQGYRGEGGVGGQRGQRGLEAEPPPDPVYPEAWAEGRALRLEHDDAFEAALWNAGPA